MCRPDCKMCVQLQDGLVSVRCTGGAILQKGVNGRKESTRLPCAALEVVCVCVCVSVCVCVCVCVWTFQCMSLDKWSPTFGRIVLPSSWTVKFIFVDLDSWNESTTIFRNVGTDAPMDVASLLSEDCRLFLLCCAQCRTMMNTGLWCRCCSPALRSCLFK